MVGATGCWCGAVSKSNLSTPTTGFTRPGAKPHWNCSCVRPVNAGRLSKPSRPPSLGSPQTGLCPRGVKANAGWITMKFATGKAGIGTLPWPCWPTQFSSYCAHGEKKTPAGQVPLSVLELRHLLTDLLWRGWYGIEHLLHWSRWRRRHQFHALRCHYRKRKSPLLVFYLVDPEKVVFRHTGIDFEGIDPLAVLESGPRCASASAEKGAKKLRGACGSLLRLLPGSR